MSIQDPEAERGANMIQTMIHLEEGAVKEMVWMSIQDPEAERGANMIPTERAAMGTRILRALEKEANMIQDPGKAAAAMMIQLEAEGAVSLLMEEEVPCL